ncbi:putative tail assembly chaperone [Erwinia phage Gungnir39]|nr:putative tail assembly chaperone [Erwinia phage Gungnir39]
MFVIKNPRADIGAERWFYPYPRPVAEKGKKLKKASEEMESLYNLSFLVRSSENTQFRSRNAVIQRHIQKLDAAAKVGTKEFSLAADVDIDNPDDLLIENVARFILVDWAGVGQVVDGEEVPTEYTPEKGIEMLKQYPQFYWSILGEAADIAQGKEQQKEQTVAK